MSRDKTKRFTVTLQPIVRAMTVKGGDAYNGDQLGNLLARRVGNADRHVMKCNDKELKAYFRGLADAGMMYAAQVVNLLESGADEVHVSWALDPEPKENGQSGDR